MKYSSLSLALGLLGACASAPQEVPLVHLGPPQPVVKNAPAIRARALPTYTSDDPNSMWADPGFRQRWIESFLSESDIEPPVSATELPDLDEARDLLFEEKFDEALAVLNRGNSDASSAIFDYFIGNIYLGEQRYEQALAALTRALEKFPKFRRAWERLGLVQVELGRFEEGVNSLTRVIHLGGNTVDLYGTLGYAHTQLGNYVSAESAFRMADLLDPGDIRWKVQLAQAYLNQTRFPEAASLCNYLIEQDPSNADLWFLQAKALAEMGRVLEAAENLELVDQLGGSTEMSLTNLGDIYINEGLFTMGVDAYGRALAMPSERRPSRAVRAAKNLAAQSAFDETQEIMQAIRDNRAEYLEVEDRKDLLKLEVRLAAAENATEAEAKALERIVELDPLDGQAVIMLGKYHERLEDDEKAMLLYQRAALIEGFEAEAMVDQAELLSKQLRFQEAIPLLREALVLDSKPSVQQFLESVERAAKAR